MNEQEVEHSIQKRELGGLHGAFMGYHHARMLLFECFVARMLVQEFTPGDISCQEFLVVRYLELIFKKLESLNNEETIMKQIECNGVLILRGHLRGIVGACTA